MNVMFCFPVKLGINSNAKDESWDIFSGISKSMQKGEIKQMHFCRRVKPINFPAFLDHQAQWGRRGSWKIQKFPKLENWRYWWWSNQINRELRENRCNLKFSFKFSVVSEYSDVVRMSDEIAVSVCYLWADRRPNFFQMEFNLYQQSTKKKPSRCQRKRKTICC